MLSLKMLFVLVLLFCASASSITKFSRRRSSSSTFCNGLDCPEYTVVCKNEDYEVRKYPATKWITTSGTGPYFKFLFDSFWILYNYIEGNNQDQLVLKMTVPITVKHFCTNQSESVDPNRFESSFFLFPHNKVPQPSSSKVKIEEYPPSQFFVIQFSGFDIPFLTTHRFKKLKKVLDQKKVKYDESYWIYAGYDKPTKLTNRHNELWIELLQDPDQDKNFNDIDNLALC